MKPSETTALYVEACRSRRIAPQEEEGRLWHKTLALYEAKDVKAALEAWWADTTVGKDGEPRGKWLPAPAELKPLVDRVVHQRAARAAIPTFYIRWKCSTCNVAKAGFLATGDVDQRTCCGNLMEIIVDERPRA